MSTSNPNRPTGTWLDLSQIMPVASNPYELVNTLNSLLLHGQMSPDLRAAVNNAIGSMPTATSLAKAQRAVYLIGSSPEYFVQR